MKKIATAVLEGLLVLCVCGCEAKLAKNVDDDDNMPDTVSSESSQEISEASVISRDKVQTVSAPSDSISFEKACELADKCGMEELELPQSAKDYKKYYFATVDYYGKAYYSIYFYTEKNDKKVFAGTNILVSCDGELILKKKWLGNYEKAEMDTAEKDKPLKELYPDAKISPVEALGVLADKTNLGLDYDLSKYVFEFSKETDEIQGTVCFTVLPKLELSDSMQILKKIYISADGSGYVFQADPNEKGEYIELK